MKLQASLEAGDEAQARRHAEAILNLIAGSQSPNYKDWDGDGTITDESGGYGLSLNGNSPGYFQAVYSEANSIVRSANASEPMVTYGEYLKTTIQNLAQWTQQNHAAAAMHGYGRQEFIGLHMSEFVHPDSQRHFSESVEAVRSGGVLEAAAIHVRSDGAPFHVEVRRTAFVYDSRPCLLSVVRDVSSRVRAQELLLQQAEAPA